MILRLLALFLFASTAFSDEILLIEKQELDQAPESAFFVLSSEDQTVQLLPAINIFKLTQDDKTYLIVARADTPTDKELTYVAHIKVGNEIKLGNIKTVNFDYQRWSETVSAELEAKVNDNKAKLVDLQSSRDNMIRKIKALKSDAATLTEVNQLASAKLRLRESLEQLEKLSQDQTVMEAQLQEAINMKEPHNLPNRERELELQLIALRQKLSDVESISGGAVTEEEIARQKTILQNTQGDDLGILELELENLRLERQSLETSGN